MIEKRRSVKLFCCLAYLFFNIGATIFAQISKEDNGSYAYNTLLVPLAVEVIKFMVSLLLLIKMKIRKESIVGKGGYHSFLMFSIPGFCYFVSNSCMFYIIRDFGPSKYQIFSNLKILSSGILMRIILRRYLSWLQWKAIILLVLGATIVQLNEKDCEADMFEKSNKNSSHSDRSVLISYAFILLNSFFSGAGGVFSERLLKGEDMLATECIHWQNIQMYFWGIFWGLFPLVLSESSTVNISRSFADFNLPACLAILTLAASGLSVSYILKYLDNIAKCFVATLGMIFVAIYEKTIDSDIMTPTLNLVLGILLTGIALEQYHIQPIFAQII